MSRKKKKHHYIPRVYLKAFSDPTPPAGWPAGRPFESAVWVQDPSLKHSARRRSPSNILWENSLYTFASDDAQAPWLEEGLSRLEGAYAPVLSAVQDRLPLSVEQYGILLLFVGALYGRIPSQLEHWQGQFDKLRAISEQFSDLPPEGMSWSDFEEIGKRSLTFRTSGYAEVIASHGFIFVNRTPMPFVTSDRPVLHTFLHIDEGPVRFFPDDARAQVGRNVEAFFSFAPLTPATAFVASPLLTRSSSLYRETADLSVIFALNQYTRHNAKTLVSNVPQPYGTLTKDVLAAEMKGRGSEQPQSGLVLYTAADRHWIGTRSTDHAVGKHPLRGRIAFVASSREELLAAAVVHELSEVRVYSGGTQVGGMRDAWLSSVALVDDEPSIIENWPGGWSGWSQMPEDSYGI